MPAQDCSGSGTNYGGWRCRRSQLEGDAHPSQSGHDQSLERAESGADEGPPADCHLKDETAGGSGSAEAVSADFLPPFRT